MLGLDATTTTRPSRQLGKYAACVICRARKLKCDGVKPSCATCSRLGHPCQYAVPARGLTTTKATTATAARANKTSTQALEDRIKELEELVNGGHPTLGHAPPWPDTCSPRSDGRSPFDSAGSSKHATPASSDPASFAHLGGFWGEALTTSPEDLYQIMILGTDTDFPDPHIQEHLLDSYFTRIHRAVPVLHPARFRTSLLRPMGHSGRPAPFLLSIVLALGATVSPLQEMRHLATSFYENARRKLNLALETMSPILNIVQTHILLSTYEIGNSIMGCSWLDAGAAVRSGLAASLDHQDDDEEQMLAIQQMPARLHPFSNRMTDRNSLLARPTDWIEAEERRRAWWYAVAHDHASSSASTWRFASDPNKSTTRLPMNRLVWELGRETDPGPAPAPRYCDPPSANESDEGLFIRLTIFIAKAVELVHSPSRDIQGCIEKSEHWLALTREAQVFHAISRRGKDQFPRYFTELGIDWTVATVQILSLAAPVFLYGMRMKVDDRDVSAEAREICYSALDQVILLFRDMSQVASEDWTGFHPFTSFFVKLFGSIAIDRWHRAAQHGSNNHPIPQTTVEALQAQGEFVLIRNVMTRISELWSLPANYILGLDGELRSKGLRLPDRGVLYPAVRCDPRFATCR